jgi:hypothetical protein
MRRVLRALTGVWLACQLVAAASPLALVSDRFGIDQAECCPGIGPGQTCPMHHHSTDKSTCKMESACAHHDAALLTILAVGVLPAPVAASTPVSDTAAPAASEPSSLSRAVVPDLPPPRI